MEKNIHLESSCGTGACCFKVSSTTACRFLIFECGCVGQSQLTIPGGTFSLLTRFDVGFTVFALEAIVDMWSWPNLFITSDAFCCRLGKVVFADPAVLEKRASYLIRRFKSGIS